MEAFLSKKVILGLLFIIFAEVTFLFFYHQGKLKNDFPNKSRVSIDVPGDFVSILSFHYLFSLNKGSLQEMALKNTYRGRITKIYNTPGVHIGFLYERAIDIVENKKSNTLILTKNALDSLSITDWNQNSINFEDLKVGDSVEITETLDLTQRYPLADQKIVILKINQ